jgi:chemotaxis protein CheD
MIDVGDALPLVTLYPGDIFCHAEPHLVTTLLGSCVAVCLWDARRGCGGMSHSILPQIRSGEIPNPRFTDIAVDWLLGRLESLGCQREDLRAKVFGGADVLPTRAEMPSIGSQNSQVALACLAELGIQVVAKRLGGKHGLVVKLDTGSGDAWIRRVQRQPLSAAIVPERKIFCLATRSPGLG